ncbi:MAG: PIG-L family deacetylase [Ilumatobacteraceae bacterium]|nr:PIG-L family deacetylase [Ilumatobacteraceae bacterium]
MPDSPSGGNDFPARPMTMLGVWAHPDDESYLSAVLMSRVVKVGGRVVLASATRGEAGGSGDPEALAEIRERELRAAMSCLCVRDVRFLGYADGQCADADAEQAICSIIALIKDVDPDIIVTFGPDGMTGHPDHIAVSGWVTAAAAAVGHEGLIYATMTDDFAQRNDALHSRLGVWMSGDEPSTIPHQDLTLYVVPTPRERELKNRALRAHTSQVSTLVDLIGAESFENWWVDEYFRRPTVDEWFAVPSLELSCLAV